MEISVVIQRSESADNLFSSNTVVHILDRVLGLTGVNGLALRSLE